jgi:hypothetical protein
MSGLDKDRLRNQTVCFRATPEERQQIEARIIVSGMPKGQYYIQSLLHQQINIIVGKYQSDRLSLEIRRLREEIGNISQTGEKTLNEALRRCEALLYQLTEVIQETINPEAVSINDFATEK